MIVKCKSRMLIIRCVERGVDIHDALPCVVSMDGDDWVVDTEHPAYPARAPNPDTENPLP